MLAAAVLVSSCTSADAGPPPKPRKRLAVVIPTTSTAAGPEPTTTTMAPPPPPPTTTTPHEHRPAAGTLAKIAECESGGDYRAKNPRSTASGKYQVLDSTWDGFGGYRRASDAPPEVQERWASEAFAKAGTRPWAASSHCWR